jgi:hypothetical protein
MHGTDGESPQAAPAGARPPGRRPRTALIAAAVAILAGAAVAGCQGHPAPPPPASGPAAAASGAVSPSPGGAGQSPTAALAPLTWTAAWAPLPAAAAVTSGQYLLLDDVSCSSAGSCVAVGGDRVSGGAYQGLVETLSDGDWAPAAIPDVSSEKGVAMLDGVSCPAQGTCVAVGFFGSAATALVPAIETLAGGRWKPVKPPLPGDADTSASATLNDVACPVTGTCVATGWYGTAAGDHDAYVDTLSAGTWTAASVPLPKDAAPEKSSATASTYVAAVACTAAGACVAPGQYRDASGQAQAFIDTLAGGAWTSAAVPLPGDAATTGQSAALWAVACPAPGTCVAAGHYFERGGQPRYLTDTLSGGAWTVAGLPLPADAAADQKWSQYADTAIGGLACESPGNCVASAGYVTKSTALVPLIETLSGGTWTAAKAPLPADAVTGSGQADAAYLELAACPAAGSCLIVGSYPAADGTQGLIETAVPGHG